MKHSQVPLTPARHYLIPEEMSCAKFASSWAKGRGRRKVHVGWVHGRPFRLWSTGHPCRLPRVSHVCPNPRWPVDTQLKWINDLKRKLCLMKPHSDLCANASPVCRQIFTNPLCIKWQATCSPLSLCLPKSKGNTAWLDLQHSSHFRDS